MTNDLDDHATPASNDSALSPVVAAVARAEILPEQIDNEALARLPRNDFGNARRLIARHGRDIVHVDEHGWFIWDGQRWNGVAGESEAHKRAHLTAASIRDEAETLPDEPIGSERKSPRDKHLAWAIATGNHAKSTAMLSAAEPYLREPFDAFDSNRWAFNCANGTLRLDECAEDGRYAKLSSADRADRITKVAKVEFDPEAEAPRWRKFVNDILPETDVAEFVQKALGYCLTADTSDQRVLIFEGKGANGKSTLLEVVARILDDYAATTPIEMFLHKEFKSSSGPSPDVARLPGVRMVRASEPEPGARLSESMLKQWTGGENMLARHLHKNFFEFQPSGKLILSVNIRPVLVGKDHGTRRRLVMVPFTQTFKAGAGATKRGNTLVDELMEEAPGILNWLLDGFRLWWETGFDVPDSIQTKTEAYFAEMDPIGQFVTEACDQDHNDPEFKAQAALVYGAYCRWCKASGEDPKSGKAFGARLNDLGIERLRQKDGIYRVGLRIKPEWTAATSEGSGQGEG